MRRDRGLDRWVGWGSYYGCHLLQAEVHELVVRPRVQAVQGADHAAVRAVAHAPPFLPVPVVLKHHSDPPPHGTGYTQVRPGE
jgi:hypothetical protein